MKAVKQLSCTAIFFAALLSPLTAEQIAAQAAQTQPVATPSSLYNQSYLSVSGDHLVTRDGRRVIFHGVNVGGWLVLEDWMCGLDDSMDTLAQNGSTGIAGRSALESLEVRFGEKDAAALLNIWEDHWITSQDLDRIHDGGFNLIRVPISYRTLQHPDGSWIRNAQGEIDFSRMDWIVREAAARGIYTIFDLHVWPQQRTDYVKIGRPEGADIRQAMATLWTAIAVHYRGNAAIAAFDLLNEFPGNWGVQQILSRAVSTADPRRVQVVEGFTFPEFVKLRAAGNFPNSIFSDHFYAAGPLPTADMTNRVKAVANSPTPVYIGEFLAADFAAATQTMDQAGVSWSSWTYKTVAMGNWGIVNYGRNAQTDIQKDSYSDIAAKWATNFTNAKALPQPWFSVNIDRTYGSSENNSLPLSDIKGDSSIRPVY